MLNLLVESVSGKQEDSDFHVEMIPEFCSAALTFTCNVDFYSFMGDFSRNHRVKQLKLTAKPLEATNVIRAENLPPNTGEDHLMIYFESPQHGAGKVEDVVLFPQEEAAVITFHDKGVSPYVLEFILGDPQIKGDIDKKMADKNCEMTWPDPNCPNPTIKLSIPSSISSHLRTVAKIVRTWRDQVSTEFSLFISKFKVAEYDVIPPVWEAIKGEASSSTYRGVLVKPDLSKHKVFLAGLSKVMTKEEETFRALVENTTRQIDRQNNSLAKAVPLSPARYEIMKTNGLEKSLQKSFPKLKISYDIEAKNIELYGLKEEVLGSQCEILSMEKGFKRKPITLEGHVVKFLQAAGHEELSCFLFIRHNINAMFEVEDNEVALTGLSMKDLSEAEAQMGRELVCKQLTVEDKMIIQKHEWKSLKKNLHETLNAEKQTIVIEEFPRGAENQVVIAGLAPSVGKASQQIHDFLEMNTPIQKDIPVTSVAVIQFIMEKKEQDMNKIKKNVEIAMKHRTISMYGPRPYVQEAVGLMENVLASLHWDVLEIRKPGAKKFCLKNKELHVNTAKTKYNCVIHLQEDGEDGFIPDVKCEGVLHYQVNLPGGVTVAVYKDDLARHSVDVVVNAANEDLKHIGGLAGALLRAAGPKLQTDCDQIIKIRGRLSAGDAVITDAGNLPCKQVIHAVGPVWNAFFPGKCDRQLHKAITSCLDLAARKGHRSIGIPAVSSGIFGFPLKRCVTHILGSIKAYVEDNSAHSTIKQIHLVALESATVQAFTDALRAESEQLKVGSAPKATSDVTINKREKSPSPTRVTNSQEQTVTTNEGLIIKVIQQAIEDSTTDVIVNNVGQKLQLNEWQISRALAARAGPQLQQLLSNSSQGASAPNGSVFSTDGCNLNCAKVLHVVMPQWDRRVGERVLRKSIKSCLKLTEQQSLQSISIPAIGTGKLGYPKDLVAAVTFKEILHFSSKAQSLQEVNIVLHPRDTENIQVTRDDFFGTVTSPALGVHEMRIGPITYQVKTGDITKENTDIIVNSTNNSFTLQSGVSKAILDAAGPSVTLECQQLGPQGQTSFILTQSGNLQCTNILHVVGQTDPKCIQRCVLDILQECNRLQMASVALPAMGTGAGQVPASIVAGAMLDGVEDFVKSQAAPSVTTVRIVIFQQPMLSDFYTSMKGKEGTAVSQPQSMFSKLYSWALPAKKKPTQKLTAFQLTDNIDPAIIHLCAANKQEVSDTRLWLGKLILDEQSEEVLQDEWVGDFEEAEQQALSDLQKRLQVFIEYEPSTPSVKVSGLTRDVMEATKEIQAMIKQIRDQRTTEREAELYSNLVEWSYHDGRRMVPFDKLTNLQLEEAASEKKRQVTVRVKGMELTVDINNRKATDSRGNTKEIRRVAKHEGETLNLPQNWDPMGKEQVKVVQLAVNSPEYTTVQGKFAQTCAMNILKIERIQNQALWQNYQIKKNHLDNKYGGTTNEMQLFHGTDSATVLNVNRNGFNRSFAGRNAAMIGNGTYFAVNANYSAQGTYSQPDGNGHRRMYLARVLTGKYCHGQRGMITPPPRNQADPTDLYDSVTDNPAGPSMFVIFSDIQAYPEYLITFS
uniref:Poly [ADP-ribose] polymerase n=1 Tax=Xenopus tropicalis TaxID=8364 RepID=A0A1B8XXG5_XENTR